MTPEAHAAVAAADAVFGYGPYLDRLDIPAGRKNPSDNREELSRAEAALSRAGCRPERGRGVRRRSGRLRHGCGHLRKPSNTARPHGGEVDIETVPGVTAMLAVAGASRCAARA